MAGLLRTLHRLGYDGPIGLMCYGLGGDIELHLRKSMEAWNRLAVEAVAPAVVADPLRAAGLRIDRDAPD